MALALLFLTLLFLNGYLTQETLIEEDRLPQPNEPFARPDSFTPIVNLIRRRPIAIETIGEGLKKTSDDALEDSYDLVDVLDSDVNVTVNKIVNLLSEAVEDTSDTIATGFIHSLLKIFSLLPGGKHLSSLLNISIECQNENEQFLVRTGLEELGTCLVNSVTNIVKDLKGIISNKKKMVDSFYLKLDQFNDGQYLKAPVSLVWTELKLLGSSALKIINLAATVGLGFVKVSLCIFPKAIVIVITKILKQIYGYLRCKIRALLKL